MAVEMVAQRIESTLTRSGPSPRPRPGPAPGPGPTPSPVGALRRVTGGGSLLDALRAGAELGGVSTGRLLAAFDRADALGRLLLLPEIAGRPGPRAEAVLIGALRGANPAEREHAAWALAERPPVPETIDLLRAMESAGGFAGMLAGLTLDTWRANERPAPPPLPAPAPGRRLRVVQVFMQGWLDGGLSRAGAGDGGGIATLLIHLARALAARSEVEHVVTLTRALSGPGVPEVHGRAEEALGKNASLVRIAFGAEGYLPTADMWSHRRELEARIEQALRRLAPIHAVHLRFADVATLAAARACERLGIPVIFTLAPDPHALIDGRERAGLLDRDGLVAADGTEHLLFRFRLVERMRDRAAGLALLPRAGTSDEVERLVRLPPAARSRAAQVPEGISMTAVDAAATAAARPGARSARDLAAAIGALPPTRRGLPLILSAGRLHRVKGFDRLLEAWASDDDLHARFNLAIVGGDLERPTPEERSVLDALAAVGARWPRASQGLVLVGHQSNADTLELMAAAAAGVPGVAAPGGVYACASEKEEFGLALLEAMASGLSVMGPSVGGPPTYIADDLTGTIADTATVAGVREGLRRAAAIRLRPGRATLARDMVRERFTIEAMAAELVRLYAPRRAAA